MALEGSVGLGEIAAWTRERTGVVWTLEASSDLNATWYASEWVAASGSTSTMR